MAEAILASLLRARVVEVCDMVVVEIKDARRRWLSDQYGVPVDSQPSALAEADVVVLAVKPQDFDPALAALTGITGPQQLVVSIAAGKRLAGIEATLCGARIVRVMPNLACTVGAGMSVYCLGTRCNSTDRNRVEDLLGCSGAVLELPEAQFDAVTAVSGSGPAFFARFLHCMTEAGMIAGLEASDARLLARQTMLGTARVLAENEIEPEAFIQAVASPGGTTEAGLTVMNESDLAAIVRNTVAAAAQRSRELSA